MMPSSGDFRLSEYPTSYAGSDADQHTADIQLLPTDQVNNIFNRLANYRYLLSPSW